MSSAARKILTAALLALGVQLWLLTDWTLVPSRNQRIVLVGAALAAALPPVHRRAFRLLQRVRHVTPRTRAITTLAVFCLAGAYLTFTAFRQERVLYPKYHDNQSYAVQAQIIASGRLWLPPHAHSDFFDTFHVLVEPVYASIYFPGAAILFAPTVWLNLPWWVIPMLIAAGCVAMTYRVTAELVDNAAGLLAAVWLVSLVWFRHLSVMLMSHPVVLLFGLGMVWAYLHWRRRHARRVAWAFVIGAFAGFAAITRPADALCYAAPIGVAILLDLRGRHFSGRVVRSGAAIVAGAAPFLLLQLVFNYGVSGDVLTSPYRVYLDRDAPQLSLGFHQFDPAKLPKSVIPQKQMYHFEYNVPLIDLHRPELLAETWFNPHTGRLPLILDATTPSPVLMPFLLVGILGLASAPRRALFAVLPLYCILYLLYAALLRHYTPVVAPASILLGVLGARQLEVFLPRARAALATFSLVTIAGMCVVVLPEMDRHREDDEYAYPEMAFARERIPNDPSVQRPALVFVRFTPRKGENVHAEPVYNWEAAKIDDNPIIFAHDLSGRNVELLRYYAERQPERRVYYYDRTVPDALVPGGTVVDELRRMTRSPLMPSTTSPAATP